MPVVHPTEDTHCIFQNNSLSGVSFKTEELVFQPKQSSDQSLPSILRCFLFCSEQRCQLLLYLVKVSNNCPFPCDAAASPCPAPAHDAGLTPRGAPCPSVESERPSQEGFVYLLTKCIKYAQLYASWPKIICNKGLVARNPTGRLSPAKRSCCWPEEGEKSYAAPF